MFELFISKVIKSLVFPPGGILLVILIGLLVLRRKPLLGKALLWLGLLSGYLLSTPLVSGLMQQRLQSYPALTELEVRQAPVQAIVVLSAGRYRNAPEYGGDTVDNNSLARLRYGAYLQRLTGLPIVVSGGRVFDPEGKSLALVMAESLQQDFQIDNVWLEDQSRNTTENARLSKALLQQKNIDTVLLVTDALHMPRSVAAFERAGLRVISAPTRFTLLEDNWLLLLLPDSGALAGSYYALHELVGRAWYAIRY